MTAKAPEVLGTDFGPPLRAPGLPPPPTYPAAWPFECSARGLTSAQVRSAVGGLRQTAGNEGSHGLTGLETDGYLGVYHRRVTEVNRQVMKVRGVIGAERGR